jgi:hypothetical protein
MCANCHVVAVDTKILDLDALRSACKALGWSFNANQRTYR